MLAVLGAGVINGSGHAQTGADLAVTVNASVLSVTVGGTITYSIAVTNFGAEQAAGAAIVDFLPNSVRFASASAGCAPTSTIAGELVECELGNLAAGSTVFLTITGTAVAPAAPPSLAFDVVLAVSTTADPRPDNDFAVEATAIAGPAAPHANLSLTKVAEETSVGLGETLTDTITVTNHGPDTASGVTLTDALPPNVSYVSSSPAGACAEVAGGLVCDLGQLGPGASTTLTITTTANAPGSASDFAIVGAAGAFDNFIFDNFAGAVTAVASPTGTADLEVAKRGPATVPPGGEVAYTITVTNNGPEPSAGVVLQDLLPAGTTFVTAVQETGPPFACQSPDDTGTISCVGEVLEPGESATFSIVVRAGETEGVTLTNVAGAASATADVNSTNNVAVARTDVVVPPPEVDVGMAKTGPPTVRVGDTFTYVVTVRNEEGRATATAVTVVDPLPFLVSFVSASTTRGACSNTGAIVTCAVGDVAGGESATITIVVRAARVGTAVNTAAVSTSAGDTNAANNAASAATTIVPRSPPAPPSPPTLDLALTLTSAKSRLSTGQTVTFVETATNKGPVAATGVTVTDVLPPGFEFVSASATQGDCRFEAFVICRLGTLGSGMSATVTVVARATRAGTQTNSAVVFGNEFDVAASNNVGWTSVQVTPFQPRRRKRPTRRHRPSRPPSFTGASRSY